jgi:hypothetical protein
LPFFGLRLLAIVMFVFLWFTAFDYQFGIFKPFFLSDHGNMREPFSISNYLTNSNILEPSPTYIHDDQKPKTKQRQTIQWPKAVNQRKANITMAKSRKPKKGKHHNGQKP